MMHAVYFFNSNTFSPATSKLLNFFYPFQSEYGREFPLFEVDATVVEPIFQKLYSFIFDMESGYSATEMDRPVPSAIFVVNFDKV